MFQRRPKLVLTKTLPRVARWSSMKRWKAFLGSNDICQARRSRSQVPFILWAGLDWCYDCFTLMAVLFCCWGCLSCLERSQKWTLRRKQLFTQLMLHSPCNFRLNLEIKTPKLSQLCLLPQLQFQKIFALRTSSHVPLKQAPQSFEPTAATAVLPTLHPSSKSSKLTWHQALGNPDTKLHSSVIQRHTPSSNAAQWRNERFLSSIGICWEINPLFAGRKRWKC